ncbi:MAG: DUF4143 domain-containing protein [Steroidobacteraceae bacterium]
MRLRSGTPTGNGRRRNGGALVFLPALWIVDGGHGSLLDGHIISLLNQTELGRDVGISQPQVHRFMNLMETSFQAIRLPAYSVIRTKRLIKAPKLYWCDTALALHLAAESEPRGPHLENLVLMDLLAWRDRQARRPEGRNKRDTFTAGRV